MAAVRSASDAGVAVAIQSDAPVTPLGPLFTAWCAVNRQTMSGRTLGAAQKISVAEALRLITLGAACTLKLDDEIGSIETGKIADCAILGADPLAVLQVARQIAVDAVFAQHGLACLALLPDAVVGPLILDP